MTKRPKTIFLDIDGTLVQHKGDASSCLFDIPIVLPNVLHTLNLWDQKGYNIILVSGRRESTRKRTEEQLREAGIFYDQLILGVGGGDRVLVNDFKPNSTRPTAYAICLERDKGFENNKEIQEV